jgi:uncharacterized protein (UPF0303 family)
MTEYENLLAEITAQEEEIQFDAFSNETALLIGLRLVEVAQAEGKVVTIDISRGEQQLFHYALPGTCADNDAWIQRKNRVVRRFGRASFYMGTLYRSTTTSIDAKHLLDPREYAAHGGAFPIIIRGTGVIGTVTVSGLPQEEDHELVVRVLREFVHR